MAALHEAPAPLDEASMNVQIASTHDTTRTHMAALELETDDVAEAPAPLDEASTAPLDEASMNIQVANALADEFSRATRPELVRTLTAREVNVLNHTPDQIFAMIDKNGDGSIDKAEFKRGIEVVQSAAKAQQAHEKKLNEKLAKSQRQKKWLGVLVVLLAISTTCNFGIAIAAIKQLREQYVSEPSTDSTTTSPFMVDSFGGVLATAKAETELSLFVAPVLSAKRLASIHRLSISYTAAAGNTVWAALDVVGIFQHSRTHVLFKLTEGGTVEVLNGDAVYREADGEAHALCASTVTCSALTVDDAVDADALVAEAEAELVLANVTVADSEGRRLNTICAKSEKQGYIAGLNYGEVTCNTKLDSLNSQLDDCTTQLDDCTAKLYGCRLPCNLATGDGCYCEWHSDCAGNGF